MGFLTAAPLFSPADSPSSFPGFSFGSRIRLRAGLLCALLLTGPLSPAFASDTYQPQSGDIFKESWRWTELDILAPYVVRQASRGTDGTVWFAVHGGAVAYDGHEVTPRLIAQPDWGEPNTLAIHAARSGDVHILAKNFGARLHDGKWELLFRTDTIGQSSGSRIAEADDGSIWFGVPDGLYRVKDGHPIRVTLASNAFAAIAIDRQNRLWLADRRTAEILCYELDPNTGLPVGEPLRLSTQLETPGSFIVEFSEGNGNRMWIATNSDRQALRFVEDGAVTTVLKDWSEFGPTKRYLLERPDGTLWVVTHRMFATYRQGAWSFHDMEDYATWFSFMYPLDQDSLLLGGHTDKTYHFDASDRHWRSLLNLNFQAHSADGYDWFLTADQRVLRHGRTSDEWMTFDASDGSIDMPQRIVTTDEGCVWVAGSHQGQAAVAWFRDGHWSRHCFPELGSSINPDSLCPGSSGWIVFGTEGNPLRPGMPITSALLRYRISADGTLEQGDSPIPNLSGKIRQIIRTPDGTLWFTSGASLYRQPDGAPPQNIAAFRGNWVDSLAVDGEGTVWVLAWRTGLSRLTADGWEGIPFPARRHGERPVAILSRHDTTGVWVATTDGLSRFDGRSWSRHRALPEMELVRGQSELVAGADDSLWINSRQSGDDATTADKVAAVTFKTVRYQPDRNAPETRLLAHERTLMEDSNAVFAWDGGDAWSRTRIGDLQYSWRVNNDPWSPFQRDTSAVLSALAPGQYHFEVRARDLDWNIDPTPATTDFTVTAFLWKRPWFIALMVATFITIVGLIALLVRQRIRHLIAIEEFKIDFFTKVSHELRTPLAAIIGPVESMLNKQAPPAMRDNLVRVYRNARRMLGLVNNLLEFRKVELGLLKYEPLRSDIVPFLHDAVHAHVNLWESKHQTVTFETSLPHAICSFDPEKLQHIVSNLLSNAIKYTPEQGDIRVQADTREADPRPAAIRNARPIRSCPWLQLIVEDNGVGIAPEHQTTIFKPFYREQNHAKDQPGSGIGLAYTSELVKLWGGTIRVESPLDPTAPDEAVGSRFTVLLPLREAPGGSRTTPAALDPAVDTAAVAALPSPEEILAVKPSEASTETPEDVSDVEEAENPSTEKGPDTILLVEDNVDFRSFLESELAESYRVLTAENGHEALELVQKTPPDLVVTDLMMPVMDGLELCTKLKSNRETCHLPVIMLTAKGSDTSRMQGMETGADEFFSKPVRIDLLKIRIRNLLDSRRQMRQRFTRQILVQPSEITVTPLDEQFLRKAIGVVEEHMRDEAFDVEAFSHYMGMGRASLYRKMNAIVGEPPFQFIRSIRLKRAAQLLESGNYNVSETMELTGINGLSHFGKIFRDQFGASPSEYRSRFQKQASTADSN